MSYQDEIAPIGNSEARLAELLHQALLRGPDGESLLFEALWDPYAPLRLRAADELADTMSNGLAIRVAQLATGTAQAPLPGPVTIDVRRAAALALRTDALPPEAHTLLVRAANDADEVVRYHALLALHRNADTATLQSVTARGLVDSDAGVNVVAAQIAAENRWEEMVGLMNAAFDRLSGSDKFQIAVALTELIEPEHASAELVDVLIQALKDEKTLAAACKAIGRLRPARAVAPLRKSMSSFFAHPLNRVEAAAALVALGDEEGTRYLEKMLAGRRKDTRGYAIEMVARLGLESYRSLIESIARSTDYHADTAVLALRNFGDSRAFELLRDISHHHPDPEIRQLAKETSAADGTPD